MRTECSMNKPLLEAGSEEMEVKGPRWWAEERLGEDFWWPGERIGKEKAKAGRTGESSGRGAGLFSEGAGLL